LVACDSSTHDRESKWPALAVRFQTFLVVRGFSDNNEAGHRQDLAAECNFVQLTVAAHEWDSVAVLPAVGTKRRAIRFFLSSTFRDMETERDELTKRVFPELRHMCDGRGLIWGDVDLRWGIPDDAGTEGRLLSLCLAEVERCRPFFIGILGDRYGWVPRELPAELVESYPWLASSAGESVTAIEIRFGPLREGSATNHAFFYFRSDASESTESEPEHQQALTDLKQDIRVRGFPVRVYGSPQELAELVRYDLKSLVERLYPQSDQLEPFRRENDAHEAFAAQHNRVYIARPELLQYLDMNASGDGPPLAITGESGIGKSALLANWAENWRRRHPEDAMVLHFIGSTPGSSNWASMTRRLITAIGRHFGIPVELVDDAAALRRSFARTLHMAAEKGRVVLLLDDLNELQDREGARELVWLPVKLPANGINARWSRHRRLAPAGMDHAGFSAAGQGGTREARPRVSGAIREADERGAGTGACLGKRLEQSAIPSGRARGASASRPARKSGRTDSLLFGRRESAGTLPENPFALGRGLRA
jgi:hypothetical protein